MRGVDIPRPLDTPIKAIELESLTFLLIGGLPKVLSKPDLQFNYRLVRLNTFMWDRLYFLGPFTFTYSLSSCNYLHAPAERNGTKLELINSTTEIDLCQV